MKRMLMWIYMLNKRLYKRWTYVGILVLIFASLLGFVAVSGEDSGFVHVILTRIPGEDDRSTAMIEQLLQEDSIVRFTPMDSAEQGIEAVKDGSADAVWIFPATFEETDAESEPMVRVVEREQNVFLRLSREKLYGLLYQYSARALFVDYTRDKLSQLDHLTEEELLTYFEDCKINDDLFVYDNPVSSGDTASSNYLTAPLKGLLAILCVLGGMAGVLYSLQDEERKAFSNLPVTKRPMIGMLTVLSSAFHVGVVSLLALWVSGLYSLGLWEILSTVLLVLCTVSFAMVLRALFGSMRSFGAVIPTMITAMTFLCPVFFNLTETRYLAHLFPPTYYIHSTYNKSYFLYMCLYCILGLALAQLIGWLKRGKKA